MDGVAIFLSCMQFTNDAECCSDASSGERAGVTVGEDILDGADGICALDGHFFIHFEVFAPDIESFTEEGVRSGIVDV